MQTLTDRYPHLTAAALAALALEGAGEETLEKLEAEAVRLSLLAGYSEIKELAAA